MNVYFTVNEFGCDPLGEDGRTAERSAQTLAEPVAQRVSRAERDRARPDLLRLAELGVIDLRRRR